jgi:hypothetical protein
MAKKNETELDNANDDGNTLFWVRFAIRSAATVISDIIQQSVVHLF